MSVESTRVEAPAAAGALRAVSRFTWRRPRLVTLGQISAPVAAFLLVYVAALVALLIQSLWTTDSFTGKVIHTWNLDNFREIADDPYPTIIWRTIVIASAVTITCMLLAFPYAYFLVRIASRRLRIALLVATVLPLWVSYLVRVYSWRLILNPDGALNWWLNGLGLPDQNIAYTNWAMWLVFTYIWFPFMVLPVYAALERVPYSYLEASADLGAKGRTTLRRVILPLAVPGLVLAHARRLHRAVARRRPWLVADRDGGVRESRTRQQPPVRRRLRDDPARDHGRLPRPDEAPRGVREPVVVVG